LGLFAPEDGIEDETPEGAAKRARVSTLPITVGESSTSPALRSVAAATAPGP
jgi:hypothetical protein